MPKLKCLSWRFRLIEKATFHAITWNYYSLGILIVIIPIFIYFFLNLILLISLLLLFSWLSLFLHNNLLILTLRNVIFIENIDILENLKTKCLRLFVKFRGLRTECHDVRVDILEFHKFNHWILCPIHR